MTRDAGNIAGQVTEIQQSYYSPLTRGCQMTVLEFLKKAEPKQAARFMCDTLELIYGSDNCEMCPFSKVCGVGDTGWTKFFNQPMKSWEVQRYGRTED